MVIDESTPEVLTYLIEAHSEDAESLAGLVGWTYRGDRADMLAVLLDHDADPDVTMEDWEQLIVDGRVRILDLLVERELGVVTTEEWGYMLREKLEDDDSDGITVVLKHLPPSVIRNKTSLIGRLRSAGGPISNDIVFDKVRKALVMSRILQGLEPDMDLTLQLVEESDLSTWDTETVRVFSWALKLAYSSRVIGFYRAQDSLFIRSDIRVAIEHRNIHSFVLRFILFRDPTSVQLADWMLAYSQRSAMIGRDDPELEIAARSVVLDRPLARQNRDAIPLRALMLAMLYPTLTMSRLIKRLESEGASDAQLAVSAGLVGAYLGMGNPRLV